MKYQVTAWVTAEVLEYNTYEVEAESEEDAKERFFKDGLLVDSIDSDYSMLDTSVDEVTLIK